MERERASERERARAKESYGQVMVITIGARVRAKLCVLLKPPPPMHCKLNMSCAFSVSALHATFCLKSASGKSCAGEAKE